MIDTYFDRVDAAQGYRPQASNLVHEDPRHYRGQLYATVIDRNVAEARDRLAGALDRDWVHHRGESRAGIKLGDHRSLFTTTGCRK